MRQGDRTWRPDPPRVPVPGWAWLLALVLLALVVGGYAVLVMLAR